MATKIDPTIHSCASHIDSFEKQHKIPSGLLHAISKVESGRKDDTGRIVAWPWTVNAEGAGYFFATKEEAIIAVKQMMREGTKSIDVGCMQVNLYHHPNAFDTLSDAFDPQTNIHYAAKFLGGLKNEHGTWQKAVAHYHSANPYHHVPYRKKVLTVWERDQKRGGTSLAPGVFASFDSATIEDTPLNRIRKITNSRVKLNRNMLIKTSQNYTVRRVTRGETSRLRRVKSKSL
jgi:hypothetical protein